MVSISLLAARQSPELSTAPQRSVVRCRGTVLFEGARFPCPKLLYTSKALDTQPRSKLTGYEPLLRQALKQPPRVPDDAVERSKSAEQTRLDSDKAFLKPLLDGQGREAGNDGVARRKERCSEFSCVEVCSTPSHWRFRAHVCGYPRPSKAMHPLSSHRGFVFFLGPPGQEPRQPSGPVDSLRIKRCDTGERLRVRHPFFSVSVSMVFAFFFMFRFGSRAARSVQFRRVCRFVSFRRCRYGEACDSSSTRGDGEGG